MSDQSSQSSFDDLLDVLTDVFDHGAIVVDNITVDQLGIPTPCRDWDVRTLLGHMLGVISTMGNGASGRPVTPVADYQLHDDHIAQFHAETTLTLAAWRSCTQNTIVDVGGGPMPASVALSINLIDTAAHIWDLARATGRSMDLPERTAAIILDLARQIVTDEGRASVGFDPQIPVGANASSTTQLVAYLGRQP
jgi:uncharacterized protein (TIGR03086 family)